MDRLLFYFKMALSVDYIYDFALKLIRKNQAGSLSSTAFAKHWNDAQATYQDDLLGRFQARSNGKSGINTGLIENRTTLQKLAPFTKLYTLTITTGEADKPADFIYELAMRINGKEVIHINHNQIATVNDNVIDPPSISNDQYYVVEYEDYYSFLPTAVTEAELDYICTPEDVLWAYTIDGSGRQVYDAGNSVQPVWDNNSCREITKRMLTNLGVSYKDNDFAAFGKSVQTTGE
jgi:hypothetical protein